MLWHCHFMHNLCVHGNRSYIKPISVLVFPFVLQWLRPLPHACTKMPRARISMAVMMVLFLMVVYL